MTKDATIELLKQQLPGFYSVEQVIDIIEQIETNPKVSPEVLNEDEDSIIKRLIHDNDNGRLVNEDAIELEIGHNGREIQISNVDVDYDVIRDAITEALEKAFVKDEE